MNDKDTFSDLINLADQINEDLLASTSYEHFRFNTGRLSGMVKTLELLGLQITTETKIENLTPKVNRDAFI